MIFEKLNDEAILPKRATEHAAGYDLHIDHDALLMPNTTQLMKTGVTFKGAHEVYLQIHARSGLAYKQGIALINGVGVIDVDYYPNEIGVLLHNFGKSPVRFKKGDRIAQAVIQEYFITEDDEAFGIRSGGFGSTGVESGE